MRASEKAGDILGYLAIILYRDKKYFPVSF